MKNQKGFEKFIKGKKKAGTVKEEMRQQKRKLRKEIEEKIEQKKRQKFQFQNPEYRPQQAERGGSKYKPKGAKTSRDQSSYTDKTSSNFKVQKAKPIKAQRERPERPGIKPERTRINPPGTRSQQERLNTKPEETRSKQEGWRTKPETTRRKPEVVRARQGSASSANIKPKRTITSKDGAAPIKNERAAQPAKQPASTPDQMPLNKYIAHCGICSRRDAAELVKSGKVKVNGEVITEPGHKVSLDENISVAGKKVHPVKNLVYILLNKPKDYITTTDDPQNRKTVLDLIKQATQERVYPIGRLDRNTSGVLLLTNDGDLSQKLTHPSNEIRKVYAVTLDKPLEKKHFEDILKGVELEDGMAHVDVLAYTDAKDKTQIGVELHTGRNRIVRRIFESLGYNVKNLDRVMFAGLTKKNVERGKWRLLNEREVRELKYFKKGK